MPPHDTTLATVTEPDFAMLRELACAIWRQHYAGIVSAAQIDYMLAGRFADESLREQIQAEGRWLELLRVSDTPVGYCGCELTGAAERREAAVMKLGQLYVLQSHRGMGLGGYMLDHVQRRACDLGSRKIWLQVNKRNTAAIGFYRAAGFEVAREAVFDIGSGFVMDDYVMEKPLGP